MVVYFNGDVSEKVDDYSKQVHFLLSFMLKKMF